MGRIPTAASYIGLLIGSGTGLLAGSRQLRAVPRQWPGQHAAMRDERPGTASRCYSIANAPRRSSGDILLQVARLYGAVTSRWMHEKLAICALVKISDPYGEHRQGHPLVRRGGILGGAPAPVPSPVQCS